MWIPLAVLVAFAALVVAGWAAWFTVRDRAVAFRQLWGAAVVEALLLVEVLVALVRVVGGTAPADPPTFWGYAVTTLIVLPLAGLWGFAERTRWSSAVLLLAAVTVAFIQLRMVEVWGG